MGSELEPTVTLAEFLAELSDGSPESTRFCTAIGEVIKVSLVPKPPEEFWIETKEPRDAWVALLGALGEAIRIGSVPKEHAKDVLRRLSPCGDLDDHNEYWTRLWAQSHISGISIEQFWNLSERQLFAVLEAKLAERESWQRAGSAKPVSPVDSTPRGRRKGKVVNAQELRRFRGNRSQQDFAEECGVSLDTIQRGEAGKRWDEKTFITVAENLTERGQLVTVQQLENRKK